MEIMIYLYKITVLLKTLESYRKCIKIRDQLKTPLETAIHWVKHVAKNKGEKHMRMVAVDLSFYQLYNLDVWAFITFTIFFTIFVFYRMTKTVYNFTIPGTKIKQKTT